MGGRDPSLVPQPCCSHGEQRGPEKHTALDTSGLFPWQLKTGPLGIWQRKTSRRPSQVNTGSLTAMRASCFLHQATERALTHSSQYLSKATAVKSGHISQPTDTKPPPACPEYRTEEGQTIPWDWPSLSPQSWNLTDRRNWMKCTLRNCATQLRSRLGYPTFQESWRSLIYAKQTWFVVCTFARVFR